MEEEMETCQHCWAELQHGDDFEELECQDCKADDSPSLMDAIGMWG
jgi:hypothetical protein